MRDHPEAKGKKPTKNERKKAFFEALEKREKKKAEYLGKLLGSQYIHLKRDIEELENSLQKHQAGNKQESIKKIEKLNNNKRCFKIHFEANEREYIKQFDQLFPMESVDVDYNTGEDFIAEIKNQLSEDSIETATSAIDAIIEEAKPRNREEEKREKAIFDELDVYYKHLTENLQKTKYNDIDRPRKTLAAAFIEKVLDRYKADETLSLSTCWLLIEKEFRSRPYENIEKIKVKSPEYSYKSFDNMEKMGRKMLSSDSRSHMKKRMEKFLNDNKEYLFSDYDLCLQNRKFGYFYQKITHENESQGIKIVPRLK